MSAEKRGTRNPKGDDIDAGKEEEEEKKRGEERRSRGGGRRGCSRERAEVTFNVSRHAAQGSLAPSSSSSSSSLLIWRQFPTNLPSKN